MDNDKNFVGGGMVGVPGTETASPREESVRSHKRVELPPTPHAQHPKAAIAGPVDDSMVLVRYDQITIGGIFMREFKPSHYICYTKVDEKSWEADYQVLIFKRHEKAFLKQGATA